MHDLDPAAIPPQAPADPALADAYRLRLALAAAQGRVRDLETIIRDIAWATHDADEQGAVQLRDTLRRVRLVARRAGVGR